MEFDIRKAINLDVCSDALKRYADGYDSAFKLEDIAIFLDTNVLISYYGMASSEKEKLLRFLNINKNNIYLTDQVQVEFRRNRVKNIESDLFEPLRKLPLALGKAVEDSKNKYIAFMTSNKKILQADYPEEWEQLEEVNNKLLEILDIKDIHHNLCKKIKDTTSDHKDIKLLDELLNTCSLFQKTAPLSPEEIQNIEKLYDELYENHNSSNASNKPYVVFPGLGDKKQKKYPYGDFIIFNEMMKFIKEEKRDAVFLTYEKSKGDWLAENMSAHTHYIEHTYAETEQIIYILNPEKPLKLSLENVHKNESFEEVCEKEACEKEALRILPLAINDIKSSGMYWDGSISRKVAPIVRELLEKNGVEVLLNEVPPLWEHVFNSTNISYDKLCEIANKRAENEFSNGT